MPEGQVDWVDGLMTYCGNGDVGTCAGIAAHLYAANCSMTDRAFQNSDGELLIVPQQGTLHVVTEMGRLDVPPGFICLIPRRVALFDSARRSFARICLRELWQPLSASRSRPDRLQLSCQPA